MAGRTRKRPTQRRSCCTNSLALLIPQPVTPSLSTVPRDVREKATAHEPQQTLLLCAGSTTGFPQCANPGAVRLHLSSRIEQLTSGSRHHFFGYIGQCRTIPWNASGRYILGLEIGEIDRLPEPEDAATVILIDTQNNNEIIRIERTHAWNPQQGTMFFWHPLAAETQFFFNDRDVETGRVFTVLYDIEKKQACQRVSV